jgi:hypothetical protein
LLNLTTILSSDFSITSTDGEANTLESCPNRP